jgi:hypothetical protein
MFADYLSTPKAFGATLSKITLLPSVQSKTDPCHQSDQDRLVSSQEKNTSPTREAVRFRGIPKLEQLRHSSTKNLQN